MIFWLDWWLFGNGWGLASPYCDDAFYWLDGDFYHWTGGFGAQLGSFGWFAPPAGTRRRLLNREFVILHSVRHGPRVKISWAVIPGPKDYAEIVALKRELQEWGHGR